MPGVLFALASVRQHRFLTGNPREEMKSFTHVFDATDTGCVVAEDLSNEKDNSIPSSVSLALDKVSLNILRDAYNRACRNSQRKGVANLWEWHIRDEHVFLSPGQAEQMSLYWKEIWAAVEVAAEESYPINMRSVRAALEGLKELVDYAAVFSKWIHISHFSGY